MERLVWPKGAYCPHCGSTKVWRFKKKRRVSRPGLWACGDCGTQFTVTTKTPLHGTKLPLRLWFEALYLILGSSKGISSVTLARMLGVTQKTAWKLGHAVRELIMTRPDLKEPLRGTVETDTFYIGGLPKPQGQNRRGRGTSKQPILIAVERGGRGKAVKIDGESAAVIAGKLADTVSPEASLMTDADRAFAAVGKAFDAHQAVNHTAREYVRGDAHVNTVEGYGGMVHRAIYGVYHHVSRAHMDRYLDELSYRWSRREVVHDTNDFDHDFRRVVSKPFDRQLAELLPGAVGRRLHWSKKGGLRWPNKATSSNTA